MRPLNLGAHLPRPEALLLTVEVLAAYLLLLLVLGALEILYPGPAVAVEAALRRVLPTACGDNTKEDSLVACR